MTQHALRFDSDMSRPSGKVQGLKTAVIGPDERRRTTILNLLRGTSCTLMRQLSHYSEIEDYAALNNAALDLVIVDLDTNPIQALQIIERLCSNRDTTVMVYSSDPGSDLMVRCMRAGVREFLTLPLTQTEMAEAISRVAALRSDLCTHNQSTGELFIFWGAKGGSGVTTVATNFAVSMARETGKRVLLIDFDLPLGDAALNLGITSEYSTIDALDNWGHLDGNYLSKIVVKHDSGLYVLPSPGTLAPLGFPDGAPQRLFQVALQHYDYVVADSGSHFELVNFADLNRTAQVYLVTQVSVPELRNAGRIASQFFSANSLAFQVVINRYDAPAVKVDEDAIAKIVTQKPQWKIPNDFRAVTAMQNDADPLALKESRISAVIRQMARAACNLPEQVERKRWLRF